MPKPRRARVLIGMAVVVSSPWTAVATPIDRPELWRAEARLDRGDLVAAAPMIADLLKRELASPTSEFAPVCRLAMRAAMLEGDAVGTFRAWSALAAAQPTSLVPTLPPIWASAAEAAEVLAIAEALPSTIATPELASFIRLASLQTTGTAAVGPTLDADASSSRLLAGIFGALRPGDEHAALRADARDALWLVIEELTPTDDEGEPDVAASPGTPPDAAYADWARLAIGRSLALESARELRILGIATLLEVDAAARDPDHPPPPDLRVLALRLAHAEAVALDLSAASAAIERDFRTVYRGHPRADLP